VILSESNLLHKFAEFHSPKGLSESISQHLRTRHVLDLDLAFGNGFMNRAVPESSVPGIRLDVARVESRNAVQAVIENTPGDASANSYL